MARKEKDTEKKKKKIEIDPNLVDYYAVYGLDRTAERKEIYNRLRSIQGHIIQKKAGGALNSEEIMAKVLEQEKMIVNAVKTFKTDERRAKYDEMLQAAIDSGMLNAEAQQMAEDAYAEIEKMFLRGNYEGVIRRCRQAIEDNTSDQRVYSLLAQSYNIVGDTENAVRTAEENVRLHSKNMDALGLAARIVYSGKHDFEKAQGYVNQMLEIDAENSTAIGTQVYLHLREGHDDLAYSMIDQYVGAHPSDEDFRRSAAYDIIGTGDTCYEFVDVEGSTVCLFSKKEDYERYLNLSKKAVSVYSDENTKLSLDLAEAYGEIQYNEDNRENIKWCFIGAAFFLLYVPIVFSLLGDSPITSVLPAIILGILAVVVGVMLHSVSKRPYWQVIRYYLTGQREPKEAVFVIVGSILGGWLRISWQLAKFIWRLAFSIALGG